jgi:hypothetical protein
MMYYLYSMLLYTTLLSLLLHNYLVYLYNMLLYILGVLYIIYLMYLYVFSDVFQMCSLKTHNCLQCTLT